MNIGSQEVHVLPILAILYKIIYNEWYAFGLCFNNVCLVQNTHDFWLAAHYLYRKVKNLFPHFHCKKIRIK